jgi:hypothetical protein
MLEIPSMFTDQVNKTVQKFPWLILLVLAFGLFMEFWTNRNQKSQVDQGN